LTDDVPPHEVMTKLSMVLLFGRRSISKLRAAASSRWWRVAAIAS
jgi:hypothetical protein